MILSTIYPKSTEIVWPVLTIAILQTTESRLAAASARVLWGVVCIYKDTVKVSVVELNCWGPLHKDAEQNETFCRRGLSAGSSNMSKHGAT